MIQIAILLPEQFLASSVTGLIDLLYLANRLASIQGGPVFEWRQFSRNGENIHSSSGLLHEVIGGYKDAGSAEIIFIPGVAYPNLPSFEQRLSQESELNEQLCRWHHNQQLIAANCTSVAFLAESGVLDNTPSTISWWLSSWFRQRYPKVNLESHAILTESNQLMCTGATTSYFDLGLRLIERFAGPDLALNCARMFLVDTHRASQASYATLQQYSGHNDPLVTRCQGWLQDNLAQTFSLEAMAKAVGSSERTLIRHFHQALGETPLRYLQQMRLFSARRLLETTALGVEQIMDKVGYNDVSAFRRLFKRELHCSPGEYRQRFAMHRHKSGQTE